MAADTFSTDGVGYLQMGVGNDNNTWGTNANANVFQNFVDAITNTLTNTVTGGTLDLSGSPPPAAASQVHHAGLIFNGLLGSAQTIKVPNFNKWWLVKNATSGAFALTLQTPTGAASSAIPQNSGWQIVQCDGANNILVYPFNTAQIQMPDGSALAPAYSDVNETNSGLYRHGTQDWRLAINGADVVQVTGGGAAAPNIFNVLSPLSLQTAGNQILPTGVETAFAGITAPPGWYLEFGQAVSRTTDANLLAVITATATGNTHTTTTVDGLSTDLRGLGLEGSFIEGSNIPTGATIVSVNSATSITITPAAGSTLTGVSLRILPWGQGDGLTTFNIPDRRGRTIAARDNMGGTPAGNITNAGSGIIGTQLNANGGAQNVTLTQLNLPSTNIPVSANVNGHNPFAVDQSLASPITAPAGIGGGSYYPAGQFGSLTISNVNINSGVQSAVNKMPPTGIGNWIIKR